MRLFSKLSSQDMKAIGNNVIIKKDTETKTTAGIILVRDLNPTKDVETGTVVSIGTHRPMDTLIEMGAKVGYVNRTVNRNGKPYNPNEYEENDERFVNVDAKDILFVIL